MEQVYMNCTGEKDMNKNMVLSNKGFLFGTVEL